MQQAAAGDLGPGLTLAAIFQFLFQVLNFMTYIVGTVFCGHLGKVELASVTLGVAVSTVLAPFLGTPCQVPRLLAGQ